VKLILLAILLISSNQSLFSEQKEKIKLLVCKSKTALRYSKKTFFTNKQGGREIESYAIIPITTSNNNAKLKATILTKHPNTKSTNPLQISIKGCNMIPDINTSNVIINSPGLRIERDQLDKFISEHKYQDHPLDFQEECNQKIYLKESKNNNFLLRKSYVKFELDGKQHIDFVPILIIPKDTNFFIKSESYSRELTQNILIN
jgi:hypothetical protein